MTACLSLEDFERLARRRLPRAIYSYISGGVEDFDALRENRRAFEDHRFKTRVLRNVAGRSAAVELFGKTYASPFGIAPMGLASLTNFRGDLDLAQAGARRNVLFVLSGFSLEPMETVRASAPDSWFQAYLSSDAREIPRDLERIAAAGYDTLVVTVDMATSPNREHNLRAGFSVPLKPSWRLAWDGMTHSRWSIGTFARTHLRSGSPTFVNLSRADALPVLSGRIVRRVASGELHWHHLDAVRHGWRGKLVVKGILNPDDVVECERRGVDAVVLSNHGGRQLDAAVSPLALLAETVDRLPGYPVLIDGGFRRGTDVLKAIALGARMVLVGRPFNFALAAGGIDGVLHAIDLLQEEVARGMGMLGAARLSEVTRDLLVPSSTPRVAQ